jgi:hypothetical protein
MVLSCTYDCTKQLALDLKYTTSLPDAYKDKQEWCCCWG